MPLFDYPFLYFFLQLFETFTLYFCTFFLLDRHLLVVEVTTNCCGVIGSILYISIHRGDIFPVGDWSYYDKVGIGQGAGFNINIPWTKVHLLHLMSFC